MHKSALIKLDAQKESLMRHKESVNVTWPTEAHYTPIAPGCRSFSVLAQPEPLKKTLRAAIRCVTGDALFITAYPAVNTLGNHDYHRKVLYKSAQHLGYTELSKRLRDDDSLVRACIPVVRDTLELV